MFRSNSMIFKNNIATLGAECHSNGLGQDVDALLESAASVLVINNALSHGWRKWIERNMKVTTDLSEELGSQETVS